jgi:hypothetical protein
VDEFPPATREGHNISSTRKQTIKDDSIFYQLGLIPQDAAGGSESASLQRDAESLSMKSARWRRSAARPHRLKLSYER